MKIVKKLRKNDKNIIRYDKVMVEEEREYSLTSGRKKEKILSEYSTAKQINIIIDAVISGDKTNIIELQRRIKEILEGI